MGLVKNDDLVNIELQEARSPVLQFFGSSVRDAKVMKQKN